MKIVLNRRTLLAAAVPVPTFLPGGARAVHVGDNPPAPPLNAERVALLPPAESAAWLAYLAASRAQRLADQAALTAERAGLMELPPPPAGGNSEASMPLDQPLAWYAGVQALRVADNILSFQTPAGGWGKNQPRDQPPRLPGQAYVAGNGNKLPTAGDFDQPLDAQWNYVGTIDNDATLTEIRFLARVQQALPEAQGAAHRAGALRGLRYLLRAQYPNGGWPQVWPLQGGYHDAITLNDNAMVGVAELLGRVVRGDASFAFVPTDLHERAAAAEQRALRNLLAMQQRVLGRLMLWGQQHDPLTLQPVSARNYEPPALCTSESAQLLVYLMSLPGLADDVVRAVEAGVAALRDLEVQGLQWARAGSDSARALHAKPGARWLWARYYDLKTLRPLFGDRDKRLFDDVRDISVERRNGYAWFVTQPRAALLAYDDWHRRVKPG